MSVSTNFNAFCDDLRISSNKRSTISTRYLAICKRLNKDYWDMDTTSGGRYVGSYGRNTANGWVSDIDMLFEMPWSIYNKYNEYLGNGQSALLQSIKNSIAKTYSTTSLRGDGQIIQVAFSDKSQFEVLPAFKNTDGSYTFADSNSGGSWKKTNPVPEIEAVSSGDNLTNNNLRRLCRMARAWKFFCSVPINGLLIDTLAYRFLTNWSNKDQSYLYYDWMSRDFFAYLKNQETSKSIWYAIGSSQVIYNPDNFRYKATIAFNKSLEAIKLDSESKEWSCKQKWREIYGHRFPD
ncbi:MAG: nucleotidyltransferase [Acidobacteria bacterium]|nr:nucleotidyltransferase [Acidobacteriota bacterium]